MKQESLPQECSSTSPKINKGLMALQSIASRSWGVKNSEKKPQNTPQSLSKSTQAVGCFYCKEDQIKKFSKHNGFVSEMEDMRRAFLMRPGCPQFSTRTTSVSHVGSATMVDLPSPSSGVWKMSEDHPLCRLGSATSVDGKFFPSSRSACELNYPRKRSEPSVTSPIGSPTMVKKSQRTRMPWYISVIHEKDHSLLLMGEELQRFSEMETQMQKKDQEILMLQKEKEALRKQLRSLLRSKATEPSSAFIRMERSFETPLKLGRMSMLKTIYKEEDELQRWIQMQEEAESNKEPGSTIEEKSSEGQPEEAAPTKQRTSHSKTGTLLEVSPEEEEEETKGTEEDESTVDEEEGLWELREEEERRPKKSYSMTESFEEELMAQLEEYERMLMDFQNELELTRSKYSLATGAITSLQRHTDFQESQLRKVTTENELLVKELRERKQQIQDMTDKFSNLREEKKHQEIMGLIEKENLTLRQKVADLKTELENSEHTIEELNAQTKELENLVNTDKDHLRRWKELNDDLQMRNEMIQQAEQQTHVILEATQARLEKLRNKIIQAVFSVSGTKSLSTEISDNYILESLQRIISERSDFYNQLKQKGVKVPPLQQSDVSLPGKIKKMLSK
ncbi:coiled-coil domain-containing protein 27 [Rattus norvegicus]|uniref:Coiled-coil domain containing 27 n=3 Tax=Rattus norvegicus TaxID=10116 RepID=A0A0G2JV67_RAT|nr:coiled-coil domain-containing protein 27 [Rattus norvegicus]|eukprot:NP_001177992.1 coiled-coil domain-containing protein 27 [Rattus norvegicus]